MHGIYAINRPSRQLPCSSDVHVYSFDGGRTCTAHTHATCIAQYAIVDGSAKCGHEAKTLAACERYNDFITFLGIPYFLFISLRLCLNAFKFGVSFNLKCPLYMYTCIEDTIQSLEDTIQSLEDTIQSLEDTIQSMVARYSGCTLLAGGVWKYIHCVCGLSRV